MSLDDITLAVDYFDLKKIAESGQCFRWKELGPGKYLIPSGQTCAIMEQKEPDDDLHLLIPKPDPRRTDRHPVPLRLHLHRLANVGVSVRSGGGCRLRRQV